MALVDISAGDEITFDYDTTEYITISFLNVPKCLCGSPNCRGKIRGFKFVSAQIREKYGQFMADYLK